MKKISKMLALATILLLTVGITTAGYVSFLSNESKVEAAINAPPLVMELWDTDSWRECAEIPMDIGSLYGTDSVNTQFKVTKLADSEADNTDIQIAGTFHAELTCDMDGDGDTDDIDTKELDKVVIDFQNFDGSHVGTITWEYGETNDFGITDDGKILTVYYPIEIMYKQAGYKGTITITFDQYAMGEYSLTMVIL